MVGSKASKSLVLDIDMPKKIYVIVGEVSGDVHAAGLLQALRGQYSDIQVRGVGGDELSKLPGCNVRNWVDRAAVMGVWEVLKHYTWFREQFDLMLAELEAFQPDVLLMVDYPGFNLRFSKAVRDRFPQIKQVQYVCPQVWAWKKQRVHAMARQLDEVLCLFPFEKPLLDENGVNASFVGNPIVDELEARRIQDVSRDRLLVGLFPGSREREIAMLLPMMLEAVKYLSLWNAELNYQIPAATPRLMAEINRMVEAAGLSESVKVTLGESHRLMQLAGTGLIASGTATLEAAYYGLPYTLVYRVAPATYFLAKLLVKISYIGIVNILANREVVEELVQFDAEPQVVADVLKELISSDKKREELISGLIETTNQLGGVGAHARAAEAVAKWL